MLLSLPLGSKYHGHKKGGDDRHHKTKIGAGFRKKREGRIKKKLPFALMQDDADCSKANTFKKTTESTYPRHRKSTKSVPQRNPFHFATSTSPTPYTEPSTGYLKTWKHLRPIPNRPNARSDKNRAPIKFPSINKKQTKP